MKANYTPEDVRSGLITFTEYCLSKPVSWAMGYGRTEEDNALFGPVPSPEPVPVAA